MMARFLDQIFYTPQERADARTEATAAIRSHGDEAVAHLRERLGKQGRTRHSARAFRLAIKIVERHLGTAPARPGDGLRPH